jgi:uncharacterized protein (DUF1501 family)
MKRRSFLKSSAAALPLLGASNLLARSLGDTASKALTTRKLLLIQLQGGNDGLNTLIPYENGLYFDHRPTLALDPQTLLPLNAELALHGALAPLMTAYQANDLAILPGLGYPDPNRSHFRSTDIWHTASDSQEFSLSGWLAQAFEEQGLGDFAFGDGLLLSLSEPGPFAGGTARVIAMDSRQNFLDRTQGMTAAWYSGHVELDHVVRTQDHLIDAADHLRSLAMDQVDSGVGFPSDPFGQQLKEAVELLAAGLDVPVIQLGLGSFDTHDDQLTTHAALLSSLANGLSATREALIQLDLWDHTVLMTYSEFGRRVAENGNRGTDHGTAAPHFLMGGRVQGGIYGEYPSLTNLDNGDLKFTQDFRHLYATILQGHWELDVSLSRRFSPLPLFVS